MKVDISTTFNDSPILTPEDDLFGVDQLAQSLSRVIKDIDSPIGSTIALNGPWGSGKSSVVNLIRYHLRGNEDTLHIIDFKCWWFRGEEALTLAFMQELNSALTKSIGDKAKDVIPKIGKKLLQTSTVVGPAINAASGGFWSVIWSAIGKESMGYVNKLFSDRDSVEKLFNRLSDALNKQNKRFLIIIDDIDRLAPQEALLVFSLIKSVGRLPNVLYLLVFDRELAEKAVKDKYPSEGPHFLEKIIQASLEIPLPSRFDLNNAILSQIETLCGAPQSMEEIRRFMNVFYDAISPFINTPRDIKRLSNMMAITWPAVKMEVNVADYVALEVMRLFKPNIYKRIAVNKERLCGVRPGYGTEEKPEEEMKRYLDEVDDSKSEICRLALMRLFPRLEKTGYTSGSVDKWDVERRVCTEKHFDTYFRFSIGEDTMPFIEIDDLLNNLSDEKYVKKVFLEACNMIRKDGKSKTPVLLDELTVYAEKVERNNYQSLLSAIFEIADDIFRKEDSERGFSFGDNYLRIHWLIRKLLFDNCDLDERSGILMQACVNAQVGWIVDFATSAIEDYFPRDNRAAEPPEKCLVLENELQSLKTLTLEKIRLAIDDGSLIKHIRLPYILFRWIEFLDGDNTEVKTWVASQLNIDRTVSLLAKAFISESWSQGIGMFGLGDRVVMSNKNIALESLSSLIDIEVFRKRLEEIKNSCSLDEEHIGYVREFLELWEKQEQNSKRRIPDIEA